MDDERNDLPQRPACVLGPCCWGRPSGLWAPGGNGIERLPGNADVDSGCRASCRPPQRLYRRPWRGRGGGGATSPYKVPDLRFTNSAGEAKSLADWRGGWYCSIFGRPGACRAARRCRPSMPWRPPSAVRISMSSRSNRHPRPGKAAALSFSDVGVGGISHTTRTDREDLPGTQARRPGVRHARPP